MLRAIPVLLLLSCSLSAADMHADLILTNGNIITVDAKVPRAEALAIRGDRILAVGDAKEIAKLKGERTKVIDLKGRLVLPGFIEGHGHFVSMGQAMMVLDLTKATRWSDIVTQVSEAAKKAPRGTWIVGRGWHQSKWKVKPMPNVAGYPTHHKLSELTPEHPVALMHASGHALFANAEAMRLAGVTAKTEPPPGGEIPKDKAGMPIGLFRETASSFVMRAYNRYQQSRTAEARQKDLLKAIELATQDCLKKGVTSFQDAGSSFATIDVFRQLAKQKKLPVRLWVMARDSNSALAKNLAKYRVIGMGENHLTVRGIKRSIDGALGPHGAWLLEPYEDLPTSRGLNTASLSSIRETARLAIEHDYQLCIHAIGDRANREVLDVFETTFKKHPREESRRWRVEHAQHLHPEDIPRFAKLGVIASMQGIHCTSDAVFVLKRLGYRRSEQGAYVWQKLLKSGAIVSNGTDAPVEDVNPIDCFYASVTRRVSKDVVFFRKQCMTREQALRSYTLDAAYAAFEEDIKGSLTPGKLADVVVLSQDIMKVPAEKIRETRVLYTIVGGKVLYQRK